MDIVNRLSILNYDAIDFAGKGGAGVQGDDAVSVIRSESGIIQFDFGFFIFSTSKLIGNDVKSPLHGDKTLQRANFMLP